MKLKKLLKILAIIVFVVFGGCFAILVGLALADASYDTHYTQQYSYWLVIGAIIFGVFGVIIISILLIKKRWRRN